MNDCKNKKLNKTAIKKVLNVTARVLGIALCVLLALVLVLNCVLIVSSAVNPDKVPSVGNLSPLIVLTESMEPQIKAGDLILCKHVSQSQATQLTVGTVISFYDPEPTSSAVVTHQIIEVQTDEQGNVWYVTKGVNNNIRDRLPVSADNVIGVYTGVRFAFIGSIVMFAQTPVGLIVFIAVPVVAFALIFVLNRRKTSTQTNDQALQQEVDRLRAEVEALRDNNTDNK